MWEDVRAFCLFVGYGGSGHSVVGSLLDAHPRAVVSHELDALRLHLGGMGREDLFTEIFVRAQAQARVGRRSGRAGGGSYLHRVEGQRKASPSGVTVLGDKKGGTSSWHLARCGPELLHSFEASVGVPLRILHVVRNPFDMMAVGLTKGRGRLPGIVPVVAEIRRRRGDGWLDIYHEDLIAQPRRQISRILEFLGLPVLTAHLDRCEAHLFSSPNRRRFDLAWPSGARERVQRLIDEYEFLHRYSWDTRPGAAGGSSAASSASRTGHRDTGLQGEDMK